MASSETWNKVRKYFKPESKYDVWGDPDLLQDEHLLRLYDFRVWLKTPIYVLNAIKKSGHATNSYHYAINGGCATDIVIPGYKNSAFDLILDATRFGFTGIGYYPHWRGLDGKTTGGLHLDSRPLKWDSDGTRNYSHNRWMGILKEDKKKPDGTIIYKQDYIELSAINLANNIVNSHGRV